MSSLNRYLPVAGGAVAGGLIALVIASSTTKTNTVTTTVAGSAIPASISNGRGMTVNEISKLASPGVVDIADTSAVQVGDPVVAIGSPFGLPGTVTTGIVSATGRSIQAPNQYTITGAIQTDAAINQGNSGGPLLDARGRVLGLNDQIETNSG